MTTCPQNYVSSDGPRGRRATPWSSHGALLIEACGADLAEVGATVAELIAAQLFFSD
jgi:hypothetical protein